MTFQGENKGSCRDCGGSLVPPGDHDEWVSISQQTPAYHRIKGSCLPFMTLPFISLVQGLELHKGGLQLFSLAPLPTWKWLFPSARHSPCSQEGLGRKDQHAALWGRAENSHLE